MRDMAAATSSAHKVVCLSPEQGASQAMAAALLELIEPPADAVSRFEDPAGWRIEAYFQDAPDIETLARQLALLLDVAQPVLTLETVAAENWVTLSQAALPPVIAGRFTVHGSHDRHRVPRGPHAILIDAGEAFGTAHHATTAGCLIEIDRLSHHRRFRNVLDLGCGSGVLAIAAQRAMPNARVAASDIDPIAVTVARDNARRNGTIAIDFKVTAGLPRHASRYDLMIANILAGPLVSLARSITRSLAPNGVLILSGLLDSQARQVLGAYLPRGFALVERRQIAGWSTLTLLRTGPLLRTGARPA